MQLEALTRSYIGPKGLPHKGWGHFLEMRLGKTPVALNEYMLLKRDHNVTRMIVVAPNKYKHTWEKEARRFGVNVPMIVYSTAKLKPYHKFLTKIGDGPGIIFINYEALIRDKHFLSMEIFTEDFNSLLVCDESAMIKNPAAAQTRAVRKLARGMDYIRCLSGMPTPYAPFDVWAQLKTMGVEEYPNFYGFKYTFTRMGGYMNKQPLGLKEETGYNQLLDKYSFRARKIDWGLGAGVDYEEVALEMTAKQKKVYSEMEQDFLTWLNSDEFVSVENAMGKYIKLQQIASGFIYDEQKKAQEIEPFSVTPKFLDLVDRLNNYIDSKVLVIAQYKYTVDKLIQCLGEFHPTWIKGAMKLEDVEEQKWTFNQNPDCRVMVAQSQAVKYGHTLTGSPDDPCYSICFYENNYSLDTRAQCEARPQGAHQTVPVHIWDYFSCPVERKIVRALQNKKSVSDVIMANYRN